jgi:hypothetical protein
MHTERSSSNGWCVRFVLFCAVGEERGALRRQAVSATAGGHMLATRHCHTTAGCQETQSRVKHPTSATSSPTRAAQRAAAPPDGAKAQVPQGLPQRALPLQERPNRPARNVQGRVAQQGAHRVGAREGAAAKVRHPSSKRPSGIRATTHYSATSPLKLPAHNAVRTPTAAHFQRLRADRRHDGPPPALASGPQRPLHSLGSLAGRGAGHSRRGRREGQGRHQW